MYKQLDKVSYLHTTINLLTLSSGLVRQYNGSLNVLTDCKIVSCQNVIS